MALETAPDALTCTLALDMLSEASPWVTFVCTIHTGGPGGCGAKVLFTVVFALEVVELLVLFEDTEGEVVGVVRFYVDPLDPLVLMSP